MPSFTIRTKSKLSAKTSRIKEGVIDCRQRELAERESKLQAEIDALQRSIAEAPSRAEEEAKRQREALINASRGGCYLHSVLPEVHQAGNAGRRARTRPMLREERKAARNQTLALAVVLAGAVVWMLSHFLP